MPKYYWIDDDPIWCASVAKILHELGLGQVVIVGNAAEARVKISEERPDLLICNVWLQSENALLLLEAELRRHLSIIVSARQPDKNFSKILDLPKSIYLDKPSNDYTLRSCINLLLKNRLVGGKQTEGYLTVRDLGSLPKKILFQEIKWIKTDGNYTMIHTIPDRTHVLKKSLTKLLASLDERFVRVHKSCAVNSDHICRVDLADKNVFVQGTAIPVGREYRI